MSSSTTTSPKTPTLDVSSVLTRHRGRSKSEPLVLSPTDLNNSGLSANKSLLLLALDNTRNSSITDPGSEESSPTNDETPSGSDKANSTKKKPGPALKRCPCGSSSDGKSWVLKCTTCTQTWHNTCANLKGKLPRTTINQLDHWLCPWCFVPPYKPPNNHRSLHNKANLSNTVTTDSLICGIEEVIKECVTTQSNNLLTSISSDLERLSKEVKEYSDKVNNPSSVPLPQQPVQNGLIESIREDPPTSPTPKESPYHILEDDFVTEEDAQAISAFLGSEEFIKEGNREVISYGASYKYMGARSTTPKPIPDVFQSLIDKVKDGKNYALNQVLVNKFDGPNSSLAKHSDNEFDINPMSEIFTISIGDTAKVLFTDKCNGNNSEIDVGHRSIYSMTRSSQNIYEHQIDQNSTNTLRYSITMRCIHWTFLNSLYAVGDSNFGHIKFGEGRGTIGKSTPGMREFAACVEDIKPENAISYKNVVVMCGTNNLKRDDVSVTNTYKKYKGKLEEIRKLSPKCNIFVCPVLPSRDHKINDRIFEFNRLLFNDLVHSNLRINLVRGLNVFLDQNYLLKYAFHDKRSDTDVLHINKFGYSSLVKCIKTALFGAKSKNQSGRTNSNGAWDRPRH